MNTKNISWTLRIIVALLFIISAVAKIAKGWIPDFPFIDFSPNFAVSTFEVKQLYTLNFTEVTAPYFSRILIGIEFALGFLLLHNHYLKKITIPATIGLLGVFILHLSYEVITHGNTGNCGCFGELLPMTPIEAIIKNIIAIGLLVWLWKIQTPDQKSNIWILTTVALGCILGMFMIAPMNARTSTISISDSNDNVNIENDTNTLNNDSIKFVPPTNVVEVKDTIKKVEQVKKETGPKPTKSGYAEFYPDIDNGKKILCFFAPGCEHCQATARELNELKKKNKDFPEVRILFMDEEAEKIPDFFKIAGTKYPFKILDVLSFWTKLGNGKETPGVVYLWNGNVIKYYDGINEKAFNKKEMEKLVKSN